MPSRSRGNRKYNNGGVNAQQGVIVENNWQNQSPILYTVVDFVKHQSFYVLRSAYKSFPFNDGRHDGDEAKLKIFENVNYEADGRNLVREKVIRTEHWKKKVICVDMGNGIFAVKAICAFSPDYPTKCYTNIAGEVECSKESYSKVLCSNVAFDCWICFSFVPSSEVDVMKPSVNRITYKLHSVEHVNPTFDFIFSAVCFIHV
uniref:Uncharacterized protein n=1 Tax=Panagrolaimus sp. ES5 TaxID=591445 RepID=A0AC34FRR5_9BILA